jgi:hypothetical protein
LGYQVLPGYSVVLVSQELRFSSGMQVGHPESLWQYLPELSLEMIQWWGMESWLQLLSVLHLLFRTLESCLE